MRTRNRRSRLLSVVVAGFLVLAAPFTLSGCGLLPNLDEIADEIDLDELDDIIG